jgi:hypothetical protein
MTIAITIESKRMSQSNDKIKILLKKVDAKSDVKILSKEDDPVPILKSLQCCQHFPSLFTDKEATDLYKYLLDTIKWEKGIYSYKAKKSTRMAKAIKLSVNSKIRWVVTEALTRMGMRNYMIYGVYANYYRDGEDYAPSHDHKNTTQLVISFNEINGDRNLTVGTKTYHLNNGDAIIFGEQKHGITKQVQRKGRISLATFMKYIPELNGKFAYF